MRIYTNALILFAFLCLFLAPQMAQAEAKWSLFGWSNAHDRYRAMQKYQPYLENSRHVQVPQWAHNDWYAEDWLQQRDGMELIRGFYEGDILRDQKTDGNDVPMLVVGPNFYRLSGYDKRRVAHIVDVVYGITASKTNGAFTLTDWYTKRPIGLFNQNGLVLH